MFAETPIQRRPAPAFLSKSRAFSISLVLSLLTLPDTTFAQIPGIPVPAKADPKADPSKAPVQAKGTTGEVFSATAGPIHVDQKVSDDALDTFLTGLLNRFPGVVTADVAVEDGVVTLDGHCDDDSTVTDVTAFAQKVDGVRLVLNKMKTDAEVLTGREMAAKSMSEYGHILSKYWILAILAVGFVIGFAALAKGFAGRSESLLSPFVKNSLLRSVVGSVLSSLIVIAGIFLGLSVLHLTHAVLSILGLAGVAGLALGFAFRDIAENFIASMLLGVRRPFGIGDFITVAGRSGSVLSLNTRETNLITPEGNHVRIPNAVIYKEVLINASVSPNSLGTIDVLIPREASTAAAIDAINEVLRSTDGLLQEPTPRALVQALEENAVRLRASYWMPSKGIDGDKLQSDLRLRIKVAVQTAAAPPAPSPDPLTTPVTGINASTAHAPSVPEDTQADTNLRKDAQAAESAATEHAAPQVTPIDHAIKKAEVEAVKEGNNMLVNAGV